MNYISREVNTDSNVQKTAGIKARDDVESIAKHSGFRIIDISLLDEQERKKANSLKRVWLHRFIQKQWLKALSDLKKGDSVVIQFPIIHHTLLFKKVIRSLQKRGVKVVLLVHDLEILRHAKRETTSSKTRIRLNVEEKSILVKADHVIAHNNKMMDLLESLGVERNRIVDLELFDYVIEEEKNKAVITDDGAVIVAGNLRPHKAGYLYHLQGHQKYNLYGVGYEGIQNDEIRYFGSFMPDELPGHLNGSFGLIWDGESPETCSGTYGEYLRINNPHKTSLYLASGLPVIIWKEAALAGYVEENRCGITVSSLNEIPERIKSLSEQEYKEMVDNAGRISALLRKGYYTKKALEACGIELEEQ